MNVIVTSFTVTECCVNLFLSIIRPVRPDEVGGEYFIRLPLISNGIILNGFSESRADNGFGDDVVGSGDMAEEEEYCEPLRDDSDADLWSCGDEALDSSSVASDDSSLSEDVSIVSFRSDVLCEV